MSFFLNSCSENGAPYSSTQSYRIVQYYEILMCLKGLYLPLWIILVFSVPSLPSCNSCLTVLPIFSKCAGQETVKKTKGYLWTSMSFSSHMIASSSFSVWVASSQSQTCGYVWSWWPHVSINCSRGYGNQFQKISWEKSHMLWVLMSLVFNSCTHSVLILTIYSYK